MARLAGNIYPIISDGNDPGKDMMKPDGTFVSLRLIWTLMVNLTYTVTRRETVENALNELRVKMNDGASAFLYMS